MAIEFEYEDDNAEEESTGEVEEIEFSLPQNEIDEWINELTRLKEEKEPAVLFIDDELYLKINPEEEE